jgi:nucleoside-diphosphate-sugar epimerase
MTGLCGGYGWFIGRAGLLSVESAAAGRPLMEAGRRGRLVLTATAAATVGRTPATRILTPWVPPNDRRPDHLPVRAGIPSSHEDDRAAASPRQAGFRLLARGRRTAGDQPGRSEVEVMRILFAGSTGVVGRIAEQLLTDLGHEVIGLARSGARLAVDVLDRDAVVAAVRDVRPDVIMHQLTSLSGRNLAANARLRRVGTRHLVDAARASGVRRLIAQSISWAYEPGPSPATEDEPLDVDAPEPRRTSVAGVAALESAVREAPEWVILRYGMFYGPTTWYSRNGAMARRAAAGELPANSDISSFLHVGDAAAAAVAAVDWPSGAVNVCDDVPAPATEWVPAFCAAIGVPAPVPAGGERAGWARGADNAHAVKDLGWAPAYPSWRSGFTTL